MVQENNHIKVLTGQLEPIEKFEIQNFKIGYIAQYAFHHIENHLDKTPDQYIDGDTFGNDREGLDKA